MADTTRKGWYESDHQDGEIAGEAIRIGMRTKLFVENGGDREHHPPKG